MASSVKTLNSHFEQTGIFSQARMPAPEVYEQEYIFWPWGQVLSQVADWVSVHAPEAAFIIDYMCGTGFLLDNITASRPDITALGCDINRGYIDYAQGKYPGVDFVREDARTYKPLSRPELVICTAGLHHLTWNDQPEFIKKVSRELRSGDILLLAEELIRPSQSEAERKGAVLEMFDELFSYILQRGASTDVVQAAADAMVNDLCQRGEYKTCLCGIEELLSPHFEILSADQVWPQKQREFGDWLFVCRRN